MKKKEGKLAKRRGTGGRPTLAQEGQIETRILDAAAELFFTEGYGATSIDALATKAGISKRTFYDRYRDKPDLFRAVVHDVIGSMRPTDMDALFKGNAFEEILYRAAQTMMQVMLSDKLIALHRLLLAEATRFPELVRAVYEEGTRQKAVEAIAGLLRRQPNSKKLSLDEIDFMAEQFMMMVIGAPQRRLMMGLCKPLNTAEINEWSRQCVSLFLEGFNKPSPDKNPRITRI